MTEGTQDESKPYPPGWLKILAEEADFKRAFSALSGFTHFHAETLRGRIRSLELRFEEADEHFERAAELARSAPVDAKSDLQRFFRRVYALDNAMFREATDPAWPMERTGREMEALMDLEVPEVPVTFQLRLSMFAHFALLRGQYKLALETFKALIDESGDRMEDQQATFYSGAAVAARALGKKKLAERHYQNAVLAVGTFDQGLKVGLLASRLYALSRQWGREEEARRWLDRLRALRCPEESREIFLRRGEICIEAATRSGRAVIA